MSAFLQKSPMGCRVPLPTWPRKAHQRDVDVMAVSLLWYDKLYDLKVLAANKQRTASSRRCLLFNGGDLTVKNLGPKVNMSMVSMNKKQNDKDKERGL